MKKEYLPFETCFDNLSNSFIRFIPTGIVDKVGMQHPSIRDMLYYQLKDNILVRHAYINNLSVTGIIETINILSQYKKHDREEIHGLVLKDEKEYNLFCERISLILEQDLELQEILKLLNAAIHLVPRKGLDLIKPSNLNLGKFCETKEGKIIKLIVCELSEKENYDYSYFKSIYYLPQLIKAFYELAKYVIPVLKIGILESTRMELIKMDYEKIINTIVLIKKYEPTMFEQVYRSDMRDKINKCLKEEISSLILEAEGYNETDYSDRMYDQEVYNQVKEECKKIVNIVEKLKKIDSKNRRRYLKTIKEIIANLREPEEVEEESYENDYRHSHSEYWTCTRIFEDL